jgi:hypothetical protein
MEELRSKIDREVQAKLAILAETQPMDAAHAADILSWQRALRWQQGENIHTPDAVPGQCREC